MKHVLRLPRVCVCDHSSMCTPVYDWAFERLMCSGFYGYMPSQCQSRFHSSVAFLVMGLPGGARFSRKHLPPLLFWALGLQQFVSFFAPALLCPFIVFLSFFSTHSASCSEMDHGGCNRDGSCSQGGGGEGRRLSQTAGLYIYLSYFIYFFICL